MPSGLYDCAPASSDPLCQIYKNIRDYLLDLLSWIRNVLNDVWDYLAQASRQSPLVVIAVACCLTLRDPEHDGTPSLWCCRPGLWTL